MTRLFIRFYVGVLFILVIAWCIQAFVFRQRVIADNTRIVEDALGGGMKLARGIFENAAPVDQPVALKRLRAQFAHPIRIIPHDEVPATVRKRFAAGDDVVMHVSNGLFVLTPLAGGTDALRFGPVPLPHGPTDTDLLLGFGAVLLMVAVAIAVLLRPLARQLRIMEQTAIAIAGGNLGARVDERKSNSAKTLARAFNDMAARTEALLRTQCELLQAVSHELRTPLSRIIFAIDLIRTSQDDHQREARLTSLDSAAHELDDLVGELLRYVRLETSGSHLKLEGIELLPLVKELIEKHSLVHEAIQFDIGEELSREGVRLVADRIGLERTLSNLLANAGRFGRRQVVVNANRSAAGTIIDVDDDGPGIPESERERVFEPFVRLDETGRGAGLGLALVKRILVYHGGAVAALDSPLGGCRIRTIWPSLVPST